MVACLLFVSGVYVIGFRLFIGRLGEACLMQLEGGLVVVGGFGETCLLLMSGGHVVVGFWLSFCRLAEVGLFSTSGGHKDGF